MNPIPKPTRHRKPKEEYKDFMTQIFERDEWMCRHCGRRSNLTIHHIKKRSQGGSDELGNCLTLCMLCHIDIEAHDLDIEIKDVMVEFLRGKI